MTKYVLSALLLGVCSLLVGTATAQELVQFEASSRSGPSKVLLRAELFKPAHPGPFPAVVLLHGCGGWQPAVHHALNAHARYLLDHGFVVLNLDSFGPRHNSGGKLCADDRALYKALSYRTADAFDALHYLQGKSYVAPDNIFLMGQSNGGAVAIRAAKAKTLRQQGRSFRGVVAYYPWCGEFGGKRVALASPLLVFAGGRDDWVPARECQGVTASGAKLEIALYPEATHSFDLEIPAQRFLGKSLGGDPAATRDSRARMLAFFVDTFTADLKRQRSGDTTAAARDPVASRHAAVRAPAEG